MGKTEEKLTLQAMERERKKREAKGKKKISYRYDHIKDLDKEVRAIKMNLGGDPMKKKKKKSFPDLNNDGKVTKKDVLIGRGIIKKKDGVARGMGAATQGGKFKGVF